MNWLNLETNLLHAPEFIGSKPVLRATWLCLTLWCAAQENGGRIVNARAWSSRQWQQTCGVTLCEVKRASPLHAWDGDDLTVWNYPIGRELEIRAKREAGREGGLRSAAARAHPANGAASTEPSPAHGEEPTRPRPSSVPGSRPHAPTEADALTALGRQAARTPTEAEVIAYGRSEQGNVPPDVCRVWWNECEARPRHLTGGYTDKSGLLVADWRASLRGFALRWRNYESHRTTTRGSALPTVPARRVKDHMKTIPTQSASELRPFTEPGRSRPELSIQYSVSSIQNPAAKPQTEYWLLNPEYYGRAPFQGRPASSQPAACALGVGCSMLGVGCFAVLS